MIQTIITPLLITLVISGILFFYFKNRLSVTERKVNLMFDLIQEHEKQAKQHSYQPQHDPSQQHDQVQTSYPNQHAGHHADQRHDLNQILEESLHDTLDSENHENIEVVYKRKKLWGYIQEIKGDKYLNKYLIFD